MKVYFGFDDTDHFDSSYGTGKLVRWFQQRLPESCRCLGVVRQQLLVSDDIPYTSHNSSACLIADIPDASLLVKVIEEAVSHIKDHAAEGSDPGLCVATEKDVALDDIVAFGQRCTHTVCTQKQALQAARKVHLSGHGGTNDGIIGATAAVGLTLFGWSGRYIEFTNLRYWPEQTTVAELSGSGIGTLSIDRDAKVPSPDDVVFTHGWLRPRLVAHRPVLFVKPQGESAWENIDRKRRKKDHPTSFDERVELAGFSSLS
jgi:tRNA(Ile2) C34 agmatinyltransferase TiaS